MSVLLNLYKCFVNIVILILNLAQAPVEHFWKSSLMYIFI